MQLRDVIASPKSNIKIGKWRSGKIPRNDFPLARSAYNMGRSVNWRVVSFKSAGQEFRVLVCIHESKEIYRAMLGVMGSRLLKLLCCFEFHGGEAGWHCHATCERFETIPEGIMRGPWVLRFPAGGNFHRRTEFGVTKDSATRVAIDRYRIEQEGPLL